ncbi:ribokinase [Hoeflea alexandrii]|uniref:ribokinase n=1 Tax=Hoeflea alexandrii TaxID=288436 RepID=UPI0022AEF41C|nr:ribokinase [Hoeflea alexandrii]MCZ4291191.1 ribokinase [Hoeflea alexandrii]
MITVIGSVNMDLIATTPRLPEPGETVAGTDFTTAQGGKGANQALAAQRAGASVKMCGAVGNDAFAGEALALLDDAGADLSLVRHIDGPTGTALILVGGDGENMIAVIPGANGHVTAEDAEQAVAAMAASDTLVLQMEIPEAAIEAALKVAKARGVRSVLNIAPLTDAVERLAPLADIVIANETEFARLSGRPAETLEAARAEVEALHGRTGQCLIVTLGGDGVLWARDGKAEHVPSIKIKPVDTVGAGDTFCGYLAQGLDAGMEFAASVRRATVAGALACLKPGAQPSIPLSADVDARL